MTKLWVSDAYIPTIQHTEEIWSEDEVTGTKRKKIMLTGEWSEADTPNRNKRVLPFSILNRECASLNEEISQVGGILGELCHPKVEKTPEGLKRSFTTSFERSAIMIKELHMDGKKLYGKAEILEDHPMGAIVASIAKRGMKIPVSTRGIGGTGTIGQNGFTYYPEDFKMRTMDVVENPSSFNARLTAYEESYNFAALEVERNYKKTMWHVISNLKDI